MSDHYSLTTEGNSIIWKNQLTRTSLNYSNVTDDSINNESYVTAVGDDENETQYLSVLETNSDVTLEDFQDITLSNGKLPVNSSDLTISDNIEVVQNESQDQQVVVFSIDGSDDLYGIQFAQDDEGNIQKYQFKFRTTDDGQLEAMPETIQLLPNDNEEVSKESLIYEQENHDEGHQQLIEEAEAESDLFLHEENLIENADFMKNQNVSHVPEESEQELMVVTTNKTQSIAENIQSKESIDKEGMKINSNYMVFVKGEPEAVVEEELDEDEYVHNKDIKKEIANSKQNDNVKNELFEEESHDLLDNVLDDNTELIGGNQEEGNIEEIHVQEDNTEGEQLEAENYPALQVQNEVTVLEYQQCLPEESVPLESADEALSNGSFENIFLERSPENGNESEETEAFASAEGLHVTADEELTEELYQVARPVFRQASRKFHGLEPLNIANQRPKSFRKGTPKKNKTILYYFMQKQEKENVDSVPLNAISKSPMKTHPRSILRCDVELRVIGDENASKSERGKPNKAAIRADRVGVERQQQDLTDKRFARSKKAVEERLFNNFISKTTIPHAPIRQTRLPRKQKIKPVDTRRNEEIIVQEVMVSSKGFVEDAEERLKNKDKFEVTSIVELSDSEDETVEKTVKKRPKKTSMRSSSVSSNNSDTSIIEIIHSDDENKPETNKESTKRGRGRPRKNADSTIDKKRSRSGPFQMPQSLKNNVDGSPSKKSRTDSSEAESDGGKKEIICPLCPKSFPSQNSLNTHIQHHNLENSLRNNTKLTTTGGPSIEYKHKCENCKSTFKNQILLNRHDCKKKQNRVDCSLCTKSFKDTVMLNIHKKSHLKQNLLKNTSTVTVSPKKIRPKLVVSKFKSPKKFLSTYKCPDCPKICTTQTMLAAHQRTHKKFNCATCNTSYSSRLLLDTHLRVSCVKTASPKDRRLSFKIRRSFVHSPRRPSISRRSMLPSTTVGAKKSATSESGNSVKTSTMTAPRKSMMPRSTTNSRKSFVPGTTTNSRKSIIASTSSNSRRTMTSIPKKSLNPGLKMLDQSLNSEIKKDVNLGLNTSSMSRILDVKAQCDSCSLKFTTLAALFKHKVKEHGLNTPDKSLLKTEKQLLHKPKVTYGGIPAHDRLKKAFTSYRAHFQESCIDEKL